MGITITLLIAFITLCLYNAYQFCKRLDEAERREKKRLIDEENRKRWAYRSNVETRWM